MLWFQVIFFSIPNFLLGSGIGLLGLVLFHAYTQSTNLKEVLPIEIRFWILFTLVSLMVGMFVALDKVLMINSIITYLQFLILTFVIIYVSIVEKSVEFFVNTFIFLVIICAITTLFWGVDYGGGRITMSPTNNPNTLGLTMTIGVGFILYKLNIKELFSSILYLSCILMFIYIILFTGSRKSLLAVALLLVSWLLMISISQLKLLTIANKVKYTTLIIVLIILLSNVLYPLLQDSVLLTRLMAFFESGDSTREQMYREAFSIFANNPVFGVGFDQYRVISIFGTYSHSTYAEILANTGLLGAVLYFSPYFVLMKNYTIQWFNKKNNFITNQRYRVLFIMYGVLLFLGFGVIHIYDKTSILFLAILIAFYRVEVKKSKIIKNGGIYE
ncbi:O-antigen ligase family protein [Halobacillus sp. B29]|uniref:O-antigen ligase family protein n=1 Tax=Halobacillus sp. B29 TaxID=3457432 RepID=UPI003FCC7237